MTFLPFGWFDNPPFIYQWGLKNRNGLVTMICRPNTDQPNWTRHTDMNFLHMINVKPVCFHRYNQERYCAIDLLHWNYKIEDELAIYDSYRKSLE